MSKQLLKRHEVEEKYTWNVHSLFKDEETYQQTFQTVLNQVDSFYEKYQGKLNNPKVINQALDEVRPIQEKMVLLGSYASLQSSTDGTSETNQMRSSQAGLYFQQISKKLTFLSTELNLQPEDILREASVLSEENKLYLEEVIKDQKHSLHPEVEKAVVALSPILNVPYSNYQRFKFADLKFDAFEADGGFHPLSFTLFENEYEYDPNTNIRRRAYESFYERLKDYNQGFGNNYIAHMQKEKAMADLRGFNSVFDYLLDSQDVSRDLMDRQIDLIMDKLSGPMRKYAKLLQKVHGLEKMTYADLKIAVDPSYEPKVTIEESKSMLLDGLSILGDEYLKIVERSFDERWIDFPQNIGKSTGGFCSSPYGANPFILINWSGQMDEVMVLAHELGHAGHFQYANANQNIFNTRPSLYFIEAPSTTNELIMARHLISKTTEKRLKRWIQSVMISRTYYHNCVTHLLEAAFQREVYTLIDQRKPMSAHTLNQIKLNVLKKFWGDDVEIPDWAGMTWMRQPHYFMGLYPYTYSAGLTLGTEVSKRIFEGTLDPNEWINVLKAGSTKPPLELARMVNVDLSTNQPLLSAIDFISQTIDEIIAAS